MSHFVVLVVLPEGTQLENAEYAAADLLEPYNETLRVPPHITECWCIGVLARVAVEKETNQTFNIDALRKKFHKRPRKYRTEQKWSEMLAPRMALYQKLLEAHPLKDKPDPQCSRCQGAGQFSTTSNPHGKWDSWVIGGRWDGWIQGPERETQCRGMKDGGFNSGKDHELPENNCRPVKDIPIQDPCYMPFAVITPDGQWHEQGRMGWFAIVTDGVADADWHKTVKELLAKYPEHLAVAVDCHV